MITLFADASTSDYPGVVQNTAQKWSEIFVSSFQSAFGQIVSANDFYIGLFETELKNDEIITNIKYP